MPAVNRVRRHDLLTLLLILFAAAFVRFGSPGVVEFKLDEAWLTRLAREFAATGMIPFTGMPSSVGLPNPPASVFVMALPYSLTSSPLVATLFVAALNVAGVGLLWLIAQRYAGRTVALVAGLAYALSPWAVYYSRKIWAQDFHTPFVLAALGLGLYGFVEGKRWAQVVCLPLLIFALQIHFAAWALLPLYLWLLWMGRRRLWWPGLVLSLLLALLTLVPYGIGLAQTAEREPGRLQAALGERDALALTDSAALTLARFATGLGLETEVAPDTSDALLAAVPPQAPLWLLLGGVVLAGAVLIWTTRYRRLAGLALLWLLLPLLVFSLNWTDVYPHYFVASIPALCLLAGVALDWLTRHLPGQPLSRTILLAAFAGLLLTQFIWWRGLMRYVAISEDTGFGTPLGALMPLRDVLLPQEHVVLLTGDTQLDYQQTPAIWHAMLAYRGTCFAAVSGNELVVQPPGPFALLAAPESDARPIDSYTLNDGIAYPTPPQDTPYRLYPTASQTDDTEWAVFGVARFSNGVGLIGYTVDDRAVRLRWSTPNARDERYQYFVHLLDANGERLAQYDGPFLDGRYWCENTPVVTTTPLDRPASAAVLRVGQYRLAGDRFINADLLAEDGSAVAPWYDIPLLSNEGS
jgi:4-amino-4-deoxy-L-arabinose transferase-like glycosyltransferase